MHQPHVTSTDDATQPSITLGPYSINRDIKRMLKTWKTPEPEETNEVIMKVDGVNLHNSKGAETCVDTYFHANYDRVMGVNYPLIPHEMNVWEVNREIEIIKKIISTR